MAFIYHLVYTSIMPTISDEINNVPQKVIHSFTHAKDTVVTLPVKLLQFFSEVGVFLIVLLVLIWIGTGWRVTVGLKKSGLAVSGYASNSGGNVPLFGGTVLQRLAAQSDIVGLGWDMQTRPNRFLPGDNRREDSRYDGFQIDYRDQIGPGADSAFSNREPPIFQEVSVDTLRSEDQERAAVAALAKINQTRVSRRPEMEYDPLPWKPFWDDWQKEKTDIYSGLSNEYKRKSGYSGPSEAYNPDFYTK
jgi:hypothetical protein